MMPTVVYLLCSLTSLACAFLLLRGYMRSRVTLLFWMGLCFVGLAANNVILMIDVQTQVPLLIWRKLPALFGVILLLHGLVADSK
jgi:hypothetical protein